MSGQDREKPRAPGGGTSEDAVAAEDWDSNGAVEAEVGVGEDALAADEMENIAENEDDVSQDDDDNPYQESDEALPDDEEEAAISRDPTHQGKRFPD